MLPFTKFIKEKYVLKEYITPEQKDEAEESGIKMSPKARENTDHFFGEGNDRKIEEINHYEHDKSEIHRKVERHLGQQISHDEYKSGLVKDKYGRDAKLGKLIKDNSLRNEFASDSTRSGSKAVKRPYMSIVRGIHVMGQTNPEPNEIHPSGHSWKDESCKNISDGSNKHYLEKEVHHGSVVVFGHDHDGKEIYRATLQPHSNDKGHVAYAVDGEYGIKHPSFVAHARDVAARLSGEHKDGSLLYKKHEKVYNDTGFDKIMHPKATPEHISKALDDSDHEVREAAIRHPKATPEHISKALDPQNNFGVREAAIQHPKATPEHISKALNDSYHEVREAAIKHPNVTTEHISKALDDNNHYVNRAAIQHPKVTPEHISKALDPQKDIRVRTAAIRHPNVTPEHISKALDDRDEFVRELAISHPKATPEHISKALDDLEPDVRTAATRHPNATKEHLKKAMNDQDSNVRDWARIAMNNRD